MMLITICHVDFRRLSAVKLVAYNLCEKYIFFCSTGIQKFHISPRFNDDNPPSLVWFDTETEARIDDVIEWSPGFPDDQPLLVVSPNGMETSAMNLVAQTMCEIPVEG